jgi:hypothetical protein
MCYALVNATKILDIHAKLDPHEASKNLIVPMSHWPGSVDADGGNGAYFLQHDASFCL